MSSNTVYQPHYVNSWALVIGINDYQIASPLGYARQDAEAFAEVLTKRHGFPQENVTVLLDQDATKERILSEFHRFERHEVSPDDRIAVFLPVMVSHGPAIGAKSDFSFRSTVILTTPERWFVGTT